MGRRVFFSFHYRGDLWRAKQIKDTSAAAGIEVAGFFGRSEYEEAEDMGAEAIRRMIVRNLAGTKVTVVLIGKDTANRPWVREEIKLSIAQNNALLGIYIHRIGDRYGQTAFWRPTKPAVPWDVEFPAYEWDGDLDRLRREIDAAEMRANGKAAGALPGKDKNYRLARNHPVVSAAIYRP